MDELQQKRERLELLLRYVSVLVSVASFWIIALFGSYYSADELELIPRLGFAAALSWVVLLHGEAMGMIIMSLMKEKWQREAREEAREQALRESWEREEQYRETIRELRRRIARLEGDGADGDEVA